MFGFIKQLLAKPNAYCFGCAHCCKYVTQIDPPKKMRTTSTQRDWFWGFEYLAREDKQICTKCWFAVSGELTV